MKITRTLLLLFSLSALLRAQDLPVSILLDNQQVLEGTVQPRKAGTTQLLFQEKDKKGTRNLSTAEISRINFDLSSFKPGRLQVHFKAARYHKVIEGLKVRINPYFSFSDLDANSNELIELFMQSLYRTGSHAGVAAARKEVAKYDTNGETRRLADIYLALSFLEKGDLESFAAFESYFQETDREDPMAPAIWMGQAKKAALRGRPDEHIEALANVIVEAPMQTEWSAEALYLSARYHQSRTNLVVAYQICQEIQTVAPLTDWPEKTEPLQEEIRKQAGELGIELVEFGAFRKGEKEAGDAKLDYKERQRALEEQEIEFTE